MKARSSSLGVRMALLFSVLLAAIGVFMLAFFPARMAKQAQVESSGRHTASIFPSGRRTRPNRASCVPTSHCRIADALSGSSNSIAGPSAVDITCASDMARSSA